MAIRHSAIGTGRQNQVTESDDGFRDRDPAERSAFNRLFYRDRRPTWFGHWVSSQHVRLVLVPPDERAPILREYVRVASSGRKHFPLPIGAPLDDFAAIAAQYPIYRIERRIADRHSY